MSDERNQQNPQPNRQDAEQANEERKTSTSGENNPKDRLKDGTNDFQNGDQEPQSAEPQRHEDAK